ncbi:cytochrome p450 4c1 [Lasius niger]|uniref:Cytochrome p450 4c1 n=1 Tax=Lasius niger TaxID=67767 RepID=A0A0J7L1N4_LASNI|nr:cytochrome p450 4c1 [Lasius niger]
MEASHDGKTLTEKNIRDEVNTILVAGSDTTAVTVNFAIFILANFPEIQEKVYEELSEIYDIEDLNSAPIKYEDLQHMDYLSRVIKETMRLFPIVACVVRHLKEDLKIGWKYGMVSMKVILATLIRTFIFKVDKRIEIDEIKLNVAPLLTVINPLKVKIIKRNV